MRRRRGMRGIGYPVLPDSWSGWSFSPGTSDATQMAVLKQYGASLPADLQAKWDAAQTATPTAAVTPSGATISTQTGTAVSLINTIAVPGVPGVFQCRMSDGSSHYCDQNAQPISYTPPPPVAAVTPAASSVPTSVVAPAVTPQAFLGPPTPGTTAVAVTPSGAAISTTTGTPASGTVIASVQGELSSLMHWLEGSLIGGISNWLLLGGAAAALFIFSGPAPRGRR